MQKNETSITNYFEKHIKTDNLILQSIMKKSNKNSCTKYKSRIKEILKSIIKKDKEKLRKVCFEGLPDDLPILRSLIWKINLRFLNFDVEKWSSYTQKKRNEYEDIKSAFIMKMEAERKLFEEYKEVYSYEENQVKINEEKKAELNAFIKCTDKTLHEEIDKDVRRTHTDLNFFFMPSRLEDLTKLTSEEIREVVDKRRSNDVKTYDDIYANPEFNKFETHADVLCRILYIYAKLNPDINYVQGMNELLAPIYFCYSFDNYEIINSDLESDTFWSFTFMMDDLKVLFMRSKDESREGIFKKMELLNSLIAIVDKDIFNHFNKHCVELSHFAFRWFILFFTQDFILPDVLRLWDSIFSEKDRFYYLFYISLAIIKLKKNKIMESDFAGIIITLQNLDDLNVEKIFGCVSVLRKEFDKKIRKTIAKCSSK